MAARAPWPQENGGPGFGEIRSYLRTASGCGRSTSIPAGLDRDPAHCSVLRITATHASVERCRSDARAKAQDGSSRPRAKNKPSNPANRFLWCRRGALGTMRCSEAKSPRGAHGQFGRRYSNDKSPSAGSDQSVNQNDLERRLSCRLCLELAERQSAIHST
jgi:hypothetical protein